LMEPPLQLRTRCYQAQPEKQEARDVRSHKAHLAPAKRSLGHAHSAISKTLLPGKQMCLPAVAKESFAPAYWQLPCQRRAHLFRPAEPPTFARPRRIVPARKHVGTPPAKEVSCMPVLANEKTRRAHAGYQSGGSDKPKFGIRAFVLPVWAGWRASVRINFCVRRRPPEFCLNF